MQRVAMATMLRAQIDALRSFDEMLLMQHKQVEAGIASREELLRRWEHRAQEEEVASGSSPSSGAPVTPPATAEEPPKPHAPPFPKPPGRE